MLNVWQFFDPSNTLWEPQSPLSVHSNAPLPWQLDLADQAGLKLFVVAENRIDNVQGHNWVDLTGRLWGAVPHFLGAVLSNANFAGDS